MISAMAQTPSHHPHQDGEPRSEVLCPWCSLSAAKAAGLYPPPLIFNAGIDRFDLPFVEHGLRSPRCLLAVQQRVLPEAVREHGHRALHHQVAVLALQEGRSSASCSTPVVPRVGVVETVAGGRAMISRNNAFASLLTKGPSPCH